MKSTLKQKGDSPSLLSDFFAPSFLPGRISFTPERKTTTPLQSMNLYLSAREGEILRGS